MQPPIAPASIVPAAANMAVPPYTTSLALIDPTALELDRVKLLLYGDVGAGKTSFAATAPNCLIISVEGGEAALWRPPMALYPGTRIVRVQEFADMRTIYQNLRTRAPGYEHFESVDLDSGSDLQDLCLYEVMARAEAINPKRPKGRPQRDDWQEVTNTLRRMIRRYRDLPMHLIITALYRNDRSLEQPGGASSRAVRGEFSPAVWRAISAYVDIIGYMVDAPQKSADGKLMGQSVHQMWLSDPTFTFSTKTRYRLPTHLDSPSFADLLSAIESSGKD